MRFYSLLPLACLFSGSILAQQVTVTNAEAFTIGTILKFQQCRPDGISAGGAGENQTWDFSRLQSLPTTTTEWMVSPASADRGGKFPGANLVEKYSDGRCVYVTMDGTDSHLIGFTDSAMAMTGHYTDALLFARRPLSYGQKVTDSFSSNFAMANMHMSGNGECTIEADGWGKLILPNKTYSKVLRVKITQTSASTIQEYSSSMKMTNTTYAWFDGEHASALLKIDQNVSDYQNDRSVEYLLSEEKGR